MSQIEAQHNKIWLVLSPIVTHFTSYLHNQHVSFLCALSSQVTHVSNEPRLSTASLSHNDYWNITAEPHLNRKDLDQIVHRQHISLVRINWRIYPHHSSNFLNHGILLPMSIVIIKIHLVSFKAIVQFWSHDSFF